MQQIIDRLIAEMKSMPVIDAHEHLGTETEVLAIPADVFTRLLHHYSMTSTETAGLAGAKAIVNDLSVPLEKRWAAFRPFLEAVRDTGYFRAAEIAARELYGIERIDDDTYLDLSAKLSADNTPGLFDRVLKRTCRIERVLNQSAWNDGRGGYCVSVCREMMNGFELPAVYSLWRQRAGGDFEDAETFIRYWVDHLRDFGFVGVKFAATIPGEPIGDDHARQLFARFRRQEASGEQLDLLMAWFQHRVMALAPTQNLVIAVHCGLHWCCWMDMTSCRPTNMIPLVIKYRDTAFDLYHAGIPWVREMAVMGNQYPNVHLNLVWTHQISPYMTEQMLNEWIDLVPVNKIIGFGGDVGLSPVKVPGVLVMARENIARSLAVRITRGQMTEERGEEICRMWLYGNPKRIYNI